MEQIRGQKIADLVKQAGMTFKWSRTSINNAQHLPIKRIPHLFPLFYHRSETLIFISSRKKTTEKKA